MSTYPFPRGVFDPQQPTPIATARWASSYELEPYRMRETAIWLGAEPRAHEEAQPVIEALSGFRAEIEGNRRLASAYRAHLNEQIETHLFHLWATDHVPIGIDDDRHMVTLGGTRAGKGTSQIIPTLTTYAGSAIVLDPKGENAKITASRRGFGSRHCDGLGQTVAVLDPYDTTGLAPEFKASWNPLDLLVLGDERIVDTATSIAESMVTRDNPEHAHFDESARALIKALILYVAHVHEGRPDRTLVTVYNYLMRGAIDQLRADQEKSGPQPDDPDAFTYLLYLMKRREEFGGIISGAATTILAMGDREKGSVLSTARRNLEFIERPAMQSVLSASSFSIDQIKTDPQGCTVYLCLPPQRMPDCGRWLRLVINLALNRMYEIDAEPATSKPVLFLLEEFATLQRMEIIEHAAGYAAGFGVKLWLILQDITQLQRYYREAWETFLGNAGVIQAFANSDNATLEFLSKKLGETELSQTIRNISTNFTASSTDPGDYARASGLLHASNAMSLLTAPAGMMLSSESTGQSAATTDALNQQVSRSPLLLPDEIERFFRREEMTQLVLVKGERPFAVKRLNYFEAPEFAGTFDPIRAPFHTKAEAMRAAEKKRAAEARARGELIANAHAFIKETRRAIKQAGADKRR